MSAILKKGCPYAAFRNGRQSYGCYMGKVQGRYFFTGSYYSGDHGELNGGIPENNIGEWFFVELPSAATTEEDVVKYLTTVLPE